MAKLLKSRNQYSSFNGVSSSLLYNDNDIFSFTSGGGIDLSFIYNFSFLTSTISTLQQILIKGDVVSSEYSIYLSGSKLAINLYTDNSNWISISSPTLTNNTFYNVTITYDASKTVGGIKLYLNNILQTVATATGGTYTGMVNNNKPLYIGNYNTTLRFFNGYLRNLKITKNNQLVFHATLQDTNAIGKDIISGISPNTVTAVSVVDINEGGNFAYFNGTSSVASIGTTSTLGWMNSGTFNMQFDVQLNTLSTGYVLGTMLFVYTQRGFMFYCTATQLQVAMANTSGTQIFRDNGGAVERGTNYRITLQGNGTQYRYIQYNLDTLVTLYDSGWVNCIYTAFATTSNALLFGNNGVVYYRCKLCNVKFYTDTAGTIPFLSLPMQSAQDLMVDRVSVLVGTSTDVQIINNNTNVLKSKNSWGYFNGTNSNLSFADNNIFSFTDGINDINGIWEFDINIKAFSIGYNFLLTKRGTNCEWEIGITSAGLLIIYLTNPAITAYIAIQSVNILQLNKEYNIKFTYDGSKLWTGLNLYVNKVLQSVTNISGGVYTGMTNTTAVFNIGRLVSTYYHNGYLRNIKITKANQLVFHLPLQDPLNIGKDIIGGLNGTVTNVSVVNLSQKVLI